MNEENMSGDVFETPANVSEISDDDRSTVTFDVEYSPDIEVSYVNPKFCENPSSLTDPDDVVASSSVHFLPKYDINSLPKAVLQLARNQKIVETNHSVPPFKEISLSKIGVEYNNFESWENIKLPLKTNLCDLVLKRMTENQPTDVKVTIDGVCFDCYLFVLHAYSEWFQALGCHCDIHFPPKKIKPYVFKKIYEWMLTGEFSAQGECVLEILKAAMYLGIGDLITLCWQWMNDATNFREDTALMLYLEASKLKCDFVKEPLLERICKFFLTLVSSKDFLELSANEVCTLFRSSVIAVNSEVEVLMAAARWFNYDWENRKGYVLNVVRCVRFNLFPLWCLGILNLRADCPEVQRLIDHEEVKTTIWKATWYRCIVNDKHDNKLELLKELAKHDMELADNRVLIYDKCCRYHRTAAETGKNVLITYKMFLEYLDVIQSSGKEHWTTLEIIEDFLPEK